MPQQSYLCGQERRYHSSAEWVLPRIFSRLEHNEEELLAELLYRDKFMYNEEEKDYKLQYKDEEGYNNAYT